MVKSRMPICEECGRLFEFINNYHLGTHKITPKEYKDKYPDTELVSVSYKEKMSKIKLGSKGTRSKERPKEFICRHYLKRGNIKYFFERIERKTFGIPCRVCGRFFWQITNFHIKTHGMNVSEYRVKYPDSELWSESIREKQRQSLSGREYPYMLGVRNPSNRRREELRQQMINGGAKIANTGYTKEIEGNKVNT